MNPTIHVSELPDFDITEHLEDDQAIAEYLTCVLEDGDPDLLVAALGDVARARGMTQIAKESGLTREALYRSLRSGASPRFDTVASVLRALGLRLNVAPSEPLQVVGDCKN